MMLLILLISSLIASEPVWEDLNDVRRDYHQIDSGEELDEFIAQIEKADEQRYTPYLASAFMQKAKYVGMPLQKLKYFNKGRALLEQYITDNPKSVDARYVRFLVQTNAPAFLGYRSNRVEDKDFILNNIDSANVKPEIETMMLQQINSIKL